MTDYDAIAKELVDEKVTFCKGTEREHKSYEPCYFDQGYSDTHEEAMSAFVSGERDEYGMEKWREIANEIMWEWQADCIYEDAKELAKEYIDSHDEDDDFDEDALREAITERLNEELTQDVELEWLKNMRSPLIRVQVGGDGEDDMLYSDDERDTASLATEILRTVGFEQSAENIDKAKQIVSEAYYHGSIHAFFLVFQLDIGKVEYDADTLVVNGDVELWACNPWLGNGWSATFTVTDYEIQRDKLRTDKDAWGYDYCEVFGTLPGYLPSPDSKFITKADKERQTA